MTKSMQMCSKFQKWNKKIHETFKRVYERVYDTKRVYERRIKPRLTGF